jgi:hypothetical protein
MKRLACLPPSKIKEKADPKQVLKKLFCLKSKGWILNTRLPD